MKYSFFLLLACASAALADPLPEDKNFVEPEIVPWKESDYALPPFPKDSNLVEFYVSAAATAKYYIDQTSLGTGTADNVVRYVMVVRTEGGATNISFEGIRCDTSEYRLYATGAREGTWLRSRNSEWRKFKPYNPQQKALTYNYFCPDFNPIKTADEGRDALRRGAHPDVTQRYQR